MRDVSLIDAENEITIMFMKKLILNYN